MPAPTTQLKADLKMIGDTIKLADGVPDSIKHLFGELVAWNEAIVEHSKGLDDRLESTEAAIDEILEGTGEMISPETSETLIQSIQHSQLLCQSVTALLAGPLASSLDDVSKKALSKLIDNALKGLALANQMIAELTAGDEDDNDDNEESDDGDGIDGDGDGDAGDDDGAGADEEASEEDVDE